MENYNENKDTVSSRLSRIFTKKRLGGLAAVLALALVAGGGASYYHHAQARAAHQQERAAMSQLNAIQAEKMGISVLSEAQIRSIAADAIGQDETAVTFDEIDLMTGHQESALKEKEHEGRDEHKKDKHKEKREKKEKEDRAEHPAQARAGAPGENARDGKATGERARQAKRQATPDDGERPAPDLPPATGNAPDGGTHESTPPAPAAGQQGALGGDQIAAGAPRGFLHGAPGPHFTYLVHCTAGGMHYTLRIDAVSGNVFPQSVRAAR